LKSLIIDGIEFKKKDVVLPVSAFKGNKHLYLGFDVTFFKNRFKDYDDVDDKEKKIKEILSKKYGKNFKVLSSDSFYIKNLDLYIDLRLGYLHNFNAYNSANKFHIDCLNKLINNNETDMIRQWCIIDVKKRESMVGKNYLEIFNYDNEEDLLNQIARVFSIKRAYSNKVLEGELKTINLILVNE